MTTADWIGRSHERVGARDRVTGALRYAADLPFDDALHVKLVHLVARGWRSRRSIGARRWRCPASRACSSPTICRQPMPRYGPAFADRPILATGETKFFGEPVAAVVAATKDAAEGAAALVHVDAEPLPAVLSVEQALDSASPLVQDPSFRPGDALANTNVLREWTFGWGESRGASAHLVIETRIPVPDGDALRHRAARLHRRARWQRRDDLDADATSIRAAARRRRRAEMADREGSHCRAGSRRWVWRQRMAEVRAAARGARACDWAGRSASCSRSRRHSRMPAARRRGFMRGPDSTRTDGSSRRS